MRTAKEKENALLIDHAGNYLGFWAQMQAFFNTGVPSLPEAEQTGKTVRESDGKSHLICPKCRFVMETPGWKICDECGYEKPKRTLRPERSQALIPGAVREINGIEATQDFSCDWWIEIISYYSRFYRRAPAKWRRISLAKYREIFGVWPDKKFVPHHKIPDKNVALILDTMYQQYKEGKKK